MCARWSGRLKQAKASWDRTLLSEYWNLFCLKSCWKRLSGNTVLTVQSIILLGMRNALTADCRCLTTVWGHWRITQLDVMVLLEGLRCFPWPQVLSVWCCWLSVLVTVCPLQAPYSTTGSVAATRAHFGRTPLFSKTTHHRAAKPVWVKYLISKWLCGALQKAAKQRLKCCIQVL